MPRRKTEPVACKTRYLSFSDTGSLVQRAALLRTPETRVDHDAWADGKCGETPASAAGRADVDSHFASPAHSFTQKTSPTGHCRTHAFPRARWPRRTRVLKNWPKCALFSRKSEDQAEIAVTGAQSMEDSGNIFMWRGAVGGFRGMASRWGSGINTPGLLPHGAGCFQGYEHH